jgi:MinD-like ATPase involved in chromosome partitioning or flagellar assembly
MKRLTRVLVFVMIASVFATACSTTDVAVDQDEPIVDVDSVAYGYFGSAAIGQGASLEISLQNVESSGDVAVVDTPAGVTATVVGAAGGSTLLQIDVADDAPLGNQDITFDIAGEPEPVRWTITILQP